MKTVICLILLTIGSLANGQTLQWSYVTPALGSPDSTSLQSGPITDLASNAAFVIKHTDNTGERYRAVWISSTGKVLLDELQPSGTLAINVLGVSSRVALIINGRTIYRFARKKDEITRTQSSIAATESYLQLNNDYSDPNGFFTADRANGFEVRRYKN